MKRIAATSLLMGCTLVLTACSGGGEPAADGSTTNGTDARGSEQQGGQDGSGGITVVDQLTAPSGDLDELRWMLFSEPNSLDPDHAEGSDADTVLANLCGRLFQLQPDMSVKAGIAKSVKRTNPSTFVLDIRKDVTFHDGEALTAGDVVWSMKRHAEPGAPESDEFENVKSIEQTGPHEVTVKLAHPDPDFEMRFSGDAGIVLNASAVKAQGKDFGTPGGTSDGCSGPFTLGSWDGGSRLVLKRFDDYWDESARAHTRQVTFTWGGEAAMVNKLKSGSADGVYLSDPTLVPALKSTSGLGVHYGPSTGADKLIPMGDGPGSDPLIRRALSLAIDRRGIVAAGMQGVGQPWKAPVGAGAWGYSRPLFEKASESIQGVPASPTEADIAEAKKLVAQAGVPNQPIVVATNGKQLRNVIANALVAAGQSIGVPVEIRSVSDAEYGEMFGSDDARKGVDFVSDDWYLSKPEPLGLYDNLLPDSSTNYIHYDNDHYVQLYNKAAATYDDAKRAKLAIELQDLAMKEMLWIPLAAAPNTLALSDELTGAPVSIAYLSDPWAADIGKAE